jgi:pyridinium-3,5-bisthiocarboxylic acid mononucleotide nickel chelatase
MVLAALLDVGVPEEHLRAGLVGLGLSGYNLTVRREQRGAETGTRVEIGLHGKPGGSHGAPSHTSLGEITAIIDASSLGPTVKERSVAVFRALAAAEAMVHGTTTDAVRFHEVGAPDAILQVVGTAICLAWLAPERFICGAVELGSGTARCAHGVVPVPAPATAEMVRARGIPTTSGRLPFEAATPTGVAILAGCIDEFTAGPAPDGGTLGYGMGSRVASAPNALRASLSDR